ncbi:unnamed protein product, partial [Urochloa humidicola]
MPVASASPLSNSHSGALLGQNMVLVRGPKNAGEDIKHFVPASGSHTATPSVMFAQREIEKARGRRNSSLVNPCHFALIITVL